MSELETLRTQGVAARLLFRIESLTPESERQWGRMSVEGMLIHLTASFELALGDRLWAGAGHKRNRAVLRALALKSPLTWAHNLPTVPELETGNPSISSPSFALERTRLIVVFERFCAADDLASRRHPIFGEMTEWDWLRWGYLHTDHHLRQFSA